VKIEKAIKPLEIKPILIQQPKELISRKVEVSLPLEIKPNFIQQPKEIFNPKKVERPTEEIYDSFVYQCQVDELKSAHGSRYPLRSV